MNDRYAVSLFNSFLILIISLVACMAIFISLNSSFMLIHFFFLFAVFIVILITYFTKMAYGLVGILLLSFIQLCYISYEYVFYRQFSLSSLFLLATSLFLFLIICLIIYPVRLVKKENTLLKNGIERLNAKESETFLRTIQMYDQDFKFCSETSARLKVPIYTMVIRFHDWNHLKNKATEEELEILFRLVNETIAERTKQGELTYLLDSVFPTWGILSFTEVVSQNTSKGQISERLSQKLLSTPIIDHLNVRLIFGQGKQEDNESQKSIDFLVQAFRNMEDYE